MLSDNLYSIISGCWLWVLMCIFHTQLRKVWGCSQCPTKTKQTKKDKTKRDVPVTSCTAYNSTAVLFVPVFMISYDTTLHYIFGDSLHATSAGSTKMWRDLCWSIYVACMWCPSLAPLTVCLESYDLRSTILPANCKAIVGASYHHLRSPPPPLTPLLPLPDIHHMLHI